jgi:hypothetical protein
MTTALLCSFFISSCWSQESLESPRLRCSLSSEEAEELPFCDFLDDDTMDDDAETFEEETDKRDRLEGGA